MHGQLRPGEPDQVSFGRSGPPRFRPPGWLSGRRVAAGIAVLVAVAVVAGVLAARGHGKRQLHRAGPVTVIDVGHRLLGVRGRWELVAAGPGVLLRIRFAAGVIARTAVPPLQSTGPVYVVAGPRQVIIRPLDFVPGYLVPDGQPARPLPAALGRGGEAFPGPRAGLVWVQTRFGARGVMSLVNYAGRRTGGSVVFPGSTANLAVPDGRGYFALQDGDAVYDIHPGRRRQVTSGTLAAVGPSAWLVTRCAERCRYQVIDPANGARRVVPGRAALPAAAALPGLISPNGLVAAVLRYGPGHRPQLHLINLVTGADQALRAGQSPAVLYGGTPALAWSPDGRWLFAATVTGSLIAIDPATGQGRSLGVTLPPVSQLAIRVPR